LPGPAAALKIHGVFTDSAIPLLIAAALGAVLAVTLVWGVRQAGRAARLTRDNARLASEAEQGREILAAAPDGLFLWNHAKGEARCSRRLAVLLGLDAGTGAGFDDVLARFSDSDAAALDQAVERLHRGGASFDILLTLGRRTIQATGTRASRADGRPLDDLMWMRDVTDAPEAASPPRDDDAFAHFRVALDALPLPVWIRGGDMNIAFANRAAVGIGVPDGLGDGGRDLAVSAPVPVLEFFQAGLARQHHEKIELAIHAQEIHVETSAYLMPKHAEGVITGHQQVVQSLENRVIDKPGGLRFIAMQTIVHGSAIEVAEHS